MISLETIEREIDELEHREASYRVCERLSWLYTVRDHLLPARTQGDRMTQSIGGSEFLEAASDVNYPALMGILDEHMSALSIVNPRQYESIVERIKSLKRQV